MYYDLTRFNAHLDDGPATPLAQWLKTLHPDLVLSINQINIWDMHMLNGTLHGSDATQALLKSGTSDSKQYILRPIGNWIFNRGWYLKDIIIALHSMGLGLSRFCIVDPAPVEGTPRVKLTSEFAIVRLDSKPQGEIFKDEYTEVNVLARQFGLSERTREELILRLAEGNRTIELRERHRKIVFEFGHGLSSEAERGFGYGRLTTMRQEFMSEFEDVDWGALSGGIEDRD